MGKDSFYFSHDSNAKDDPKCSMLIEQLGCEGYGIFWILVETLRDQPEYKYPLKLLPILARKYNTTFEKVRIVVTGYSLFQLDDDQFFSLSLCRRMERFDHVREINRQKGLKSGEIRRLPEGKGTAVQPLFNDGSTAAEPIKEKKRKENNNIASLETALADFREMRSKIKKPLTQRAEELVVAKLNRIASTEQERIEILNQSTMNCWQGVFELKSEFAAKRSELL